MTLDRDEVERRGLLGGALTAEDRMALLELLAAEGITLDEMEEAHRDGGLMRIAGERIIRPGTGALTLTDIATRLDIDVELVSRIVRTVGAIDPGPDERTSSEDDVELVAAAVRVLEVFGERSGWPLLRRLGAAVERMVEALSTAVISEVPDISVLHSGSEARTAQAWGDTAKLVPQLGRMLDLVQRHHIEAVRRYLEAAGAGESTQASFRVGVGFADLSGYTSASLQLSLSELAEIIGEFEQGAAEEIASRGGRVVKFVGDAVLFVCHEPDTLLEIADAIVGPAGGDGPKLTARAGVAYGWVLARDGDYFGPVVNLAARLVDITPPGRIVLSEELAMAVDGARWHFEPQGPLELRGIAEPVTTYLLAT